MKIFSWIDFHLSSTQAWVRNGTPSPLGWMCATYEFNSPWNQRWATERTWHAGQTGRRTGGRSETNIPLFFRIKSQTLGRSYNCLSATETTHQNMDEWAIWDTMSCWYKHNMVKRNTAGGGGYTKPISSVPPFHTFSELSKYCRSIDWLSRSYLTGVAAAQLRRHLSNMNVIKRI